MQITAQLMEQVANVRQDISDLVRRMDSLERELRDIRSLLRELMSLRKTKRRKLIDPIFLKTYGPYIAAMIVYYLLDKQTGINLFASLIGQSH